MNSLAVRLVKLWCLYTYIFLKAHSQILLKLYTTDRAVALSFDDVFLGIAAKKAGYESHASLTQPHLNCVTGPRGALNHTFIL